MRGSILAFALVLAATPVAAQQMLIPSPYPVTVPGAQPLDPEPMEPGGPQQLLRDPYPQVLGDYAQGNPPVSRRMWYQRPIPSIYQRKYRVDRPVRSGTP